MGAQQSKDELLYHEVNNGNLHGIRSLRNQGAGLEWMDKEGKTPLILACLRHDLLHVAKVLIELGANVNAYRPGSNAGTPLHHAAKKGLEQTVHLLLSHGASPFIVNDDCHTALDMAREKGHHKVVRAIENRISLFSGWLREHYGPGFLEAFVPQLMSRKIWAVVLPCDARNPAKPLKFELAVYPELQVAKPRVVISLWKVHIDEPKFNQSDPSVVIIDKATRARYKFLSAHEGDKQQLQWFYNACRGLPQVNNNIPTTPVRPPVQTPLLVNLHAAATSTGVPMSNPEDVELAMAINASIQTAIAEGVHDVRPNVQTSNTNGWGSSSDNSTHNGWGSPNVATPSQMSGQSRFDDPRTNTYNGWAVPEVRPNSSSEPSMNQNDTPIVASASSSSSHEAPPTLAPSAPPIVAETFFSGPIQYPSIDSSPVDINVPTMYISSGASETKLGSSSASDNSRKQTNSEVKEDSDSASASGGCVICLDAPVEGACIPCGHMAGCMSCLREIELKNWGCPVCRAKIDQVVRLYAV
ncbi:probable E3 ubiquitin-protein ligase XBOS34 [Typha latifolia]|uniref:probable E3 ubiquitin-protein ligase XBOS34 n=1 Tax=Typha latifolia TaxID=4733 RepID=UPI003C304054